MTLRKKTISAFSDGSAEDDNYFAQLARSRRRKMPGDKAVEKIVVYLDQAMDVLSIDAARFKERKDLDRYHATKERIEWIENIKLWIDKNV